MNVRRSLVHAAMVGSIGAAGLRAAQPVRAQTASDPALEPFRWPDIELIDGGHWAAASWREQAAVVVFWATWCPFCHRHNVHVEKLYRALAGRPLRVLGLSLDREVDVVRRHVRERGYTFPVAMGGEAIRAQLGLRRVTPTTVISDRSGRIVLRIPGEMFEEDVMELARFSNAEAK
jgi:thiol-disulfide isomerase/thioredoxin